MRAQSEAATPVNFRNALAGALVAMAALSAASAHAEWVSSAKSQARLIDGGFVDGVRYAGVQIRLGGGRLIAAGDSAHQVIARDCERSAP